MRPSVATPRRSDSLAEPIAASGFREVHEVGAQLRGEAGARQVPRRGAGGVHARVRSTRAQRLRGTEPLTLLKVDTAALTEAGTGLAAISRAV